jgi:hypothetical protein
MLQSVRGIHNVQTPLPGHCVSMSILVLSYSETNVVPTQNDQSLFLS